MKLLIAVDMVLYWISLEVVEKAGVNEAGNE